MLCSPLKHFRNHSVRKTIARGLIPQENVHLLLTQKRMPVVRKCFLGNRSAMGTTIHPFRKKGTAPFGRFGTRLFISETFGRSGSTPCGRKSAASREIHRKTH